MANRDEVVAFCSELLQSTTYQDIAVNGLQVEGSAKIESVTAAVSCNQHTINQAIADGSDAILVHHGLLLNVPLGEINGPLRARLKSVLEHDISLIGYHLPLDGQAEIGNNARLAALLDLEIAEPLETYGPPAIGYICTPRERTTVADLRSRLESLTGQQVISLDGGSNEVSRVAVLCGSGSPALEEAAKRDCQVLLTGDAREPTMAMARELGVTVLVGGHEATERFGVQALAGHLADRFGIRYRFIEDPNPL
jgi:dinuclear metal center YbgI/SA1388 family protein